MSAVPALRAVTVALHGTTALIKEDDVTRDDNVDVLGGGGGGSGTQSSLRHRFDQDVVRQDLVDGIPNVSATTTDVGWSFEDLRSCCDLVAEDS